MARAPLRPIKTSGAPGNPSIRGSHRPRWQSLMPRGWAQLRPWEPREQEVTFASTLHSGERIRQCLPGPGGQTLKRLYAPGKGLQRRERGGRRQETLEPAPRGKVPSPLKSGIRCGEGNIPFPGPPSISTPIPPSFSQSLRGQGGACGSCSLQGHQVFRHHPQPGLLSPLEAFPELQTCPKAHTRGGKCGPRPATPWKQRTPPTSGDIWGQTGYIVSEWNAFS